MYLPTIGWKNKFKQLQRQIEFVNTKLAFYTSLQHLLTLDSGRRIIIGKCQILFTIFNRNGQIHFFFLSISTVIFVGTTLPQFSKNGMKCRLQQGRGASKCYYLEIFYNQWEKLELKLNLLGMREQCRSIKGQQVNLEVLISYRAQVHLLYYVSPDLTHPFLFLL